MQTISLFEAKAKFSQVVQAVASEGEEYIVSVRGKPKVRIIPFETPESALSVWEVRDHLTEIYGLPDYQDPAPLAAPVKNPFSDEE